MIGPKVCTALPEQFALSYSENVTVPATVAPPDAVTVAVSWGSHFWAVVMLATEVTLKHSAAGLPVSAVCPG